MKKSFATLEFKRFSIPNFVEFAKSVIASLTNNPNFTKPIPTLEELAAAVAELERLAVKALTGSQADRMMRDDQHDITIDMMERLVGYVNSVADGDRTMLATTGMTLNREPQSRDLEPVKELSVSYTSQSGELLVRFKRPAAATGFIVQYSADPDAPDSAWESVPTSRSQCIITGVTPGTVYHVRVLALGARNQALYSEAVSKMAV